MRRVSISNFPPRRQVAQSFNRPHFVPVCLCETVRASLEHFKPSLAVSSPSWRARYCNPAAAILSELRQPKRRTKRANEFRAFVDRAFFAFAELLCGSASAKRERKRTNKRRKNARPNSHRQPPLLDTGGGGPAALLTTRRRWNPPRRCDC